MPCIDDACPPPPQPPAPPRLPGPVQPGPHGTAPAGQRDTAAALAGFIGSSLLSGVRVESVTVPVPIPCRALHSLPPACRVGSTFQHEGLGGPRPPRRT